ncbi:MAG: 16S rRNA (cytosine(967)-C(5))-methyltransferase RsmB [Thermodesulfobacteriota bacterium]|nr:16S rRNA (cytosine(967)-C(5))-methyltransferase RsmB [Thermodesulfobacteriota bacterium]
MRTTAFLILKTVADKRRTLDSAVEIYLTEERLPDRRDRTLATAIVYGVLRWQNTLDWYIHQFSNTPFHKVHTDIRLILRIGLFQLLYLDRIPAFAAVDGAVSLTRQQTKKPHLAGFVNGLLRNAARNQDHLRVPVDGEDAASLSVAKSFPVWMLERWLSRFGIPETMNICDHINMIPPVTVRVNTLKTDREGLKSALAASAQEISPGIHSPDALLLNLLKVPVHKMPAFQDGGFQVQDEAAQLACRFLSPRQGELIMDACAGLGGKTGYIAQLMSNQGRIVAVDNDAEKLKKLESDMKRLGVTNVKITAENLLHKAPKKTSVQFDRIFADCPCSGAGVIRRNPDIKWSLNQKDLIRHQTKQVRILDALAPRVKPGGLLVFAVCSREMEENAYVVHKFLKIRQEFDIEKKIDKPVFENTPSLKRLVDKNGYYQTMPYPDGMDGFFGVRFRKRKS